MRPALHRACQAVLALLVFLIALAVLRWAPVFARPPLDVRALSLALPLVLAGIATALTAVPRRAGPIVPLAAALMVAGGALAGVVSARGAHGLPAVVSDPRGPIGTLPPGPIDLAAGDLRDLPAAHKVTVEWAGRIDAPRRGVYRLWATGRGTASVRIDGHPVLEGEGESLAIGADVPLLAGPHPLEVELRRVGPGARLRLGWTLPAGDGRPGGYDEMVPPRLLGDPGGRAGWMATDALAILVAALLAALVLAIPWDAPWTWPEPAPVSARELLTAAAGLAVVLVVMSWPLATHPATLGVTDRPDGRLNAWILAWDVHALRHAPASLFDAPAFHPLPDALAFSENLLVPAILTAPFQAGGPVLAYNVALLGSLLLSGLGVHLLVRRVSGDPLAAFVAAALFAAGPHRWIRLAHLHAQVTLFLPFVLLSLDHFRRRPTWLRAAGFGALLALQGLSSVYLGAITATLVAVAIVVGVLGGWRFRELVRLAAGLTLAALIMLPAVRPYMRMRAFQGMEWSLQDVATYATTPTSYVAAGTRLYGAVTQRQLDPADVQDTLFPGLVLLAVGIAGLSRAPRGWAAVALAASAVAIVVSLGPETAFYRFLHEHLVLVRGVRALSRFSLIPVLALCVLAGLALSGRRAVAALALLLGCLEASNVPIRYAAAPEPSAAARWLAGKPGAVAVLPLGEDDTGVMLDGLAHGRPLVNGDSGFVPRPYTRAEELLQLPLSADALRFLRAVDVTHVVTRDEEPLPLAATLGQDRIYAVPAGEPARVPADGVPVREEGGVVDAGESRALRVVTFELTEAPWPAEATLGFSDDGRTWRDVTVQPSLADATLALYRSPRHGRGTAAFPEQRARFIRLDPRLPFRPGTVAVF